MARDIKEVFAKFQDAQREMEAAQKRGDKIYAQIWRDRAHDFSLDLKAMEKDAESNVD